jgi:tRNA-guanine family transglycosylase
MVSLSSFSQVTEEGVLFTSPFSGEPTMLSPEESMRIQVCYLIHKVRQTISDFLS